MRISIKHALTAGIVGLMLVTVATSMLLTYYSTEEVLLGHARNTMDSVADDTISRSVDFLAPAQAAADLTQKLANHGVVGSGNVAKLERYFFEQLRQHPSFAGIYYGMPDGGMVFVKRGGTDDPAPFLTKHIEIQGAHRRVHLYWRNRQFDLVDVQRDDSDAYDPRVRPWYQRALQQRGLVWTDPYIFFTSQEPGITTASPVYAASAPQQLQGVIGVDIEIGVLSSFLSRLKIGTHGSAFILNRNGDVIAHPDPDKIRQSGADSELNFTKIDKLDDPRAQAAFRALGIASAAALPSRHKQVISFELDGTRYQGAFVPFRHQRWPWVMGIYVPEDDYLGVFKRNQHQNLLVLIVIGLVATLAGFMLSRSLIRPIDQLGRQAHAIKQGDLESTVDIATPYTEIQHTVDAFSAMNVALREEQTRSKALNTLLRENSLSTIYRLSEAAEYKDSGSGTRISRMAMLSVHLAVKMGMNEQFCEDLLYAAPMHDIGKLGVPDAILFKPDKLDPEELDVLRTHPEIGARILKNPETPILEMGRQIALTHHERWDGKGYPNRLIGGSIPIVGRICAVADAFDALASDRCYKEAIPIDQVFVTLRAESGKQFDPACIHALNACEAEVRKLYSQPPPKPIPPPELQLLDGAA